MPYNLIAQHGNLSKWTFFTMQSFLMEWCGCSIATFWVPGFFWSFPVKNGWLYKKTDWRKGCKAGVSSPPKLHRWTPEGLGKTRKLLETPNLKWQPSWMQQIPTNLSGDEEKLEIFPQKSVRNMDPKTQALDTSFQRRCLVQCIIWGFGWLFASLNSPVWCPQDNVMVNVDGDIYIHHG